MRFEIDVTMRCPRRCRCCTRLCDVWSGPAADMTLSELSRVLGSVRAAAAGAGGRHELAALGGDPSLHPEWEEVARMFAACADGIRASGAEVDVQWWTSHPDRDRVERVAGAGVRPFFTGRPFDPAECAEMDRRKTVEADGFHRFPSVRRGGAGLGHCGSGSFCGVCCRKVYGRLVYAPCPNMISIAVVLGLIRKDGDSVCTSPEAWAPSGFSEWASATCRYCYVPGARWDEKGRCPFPAPPGEVLGYSWEKDMPGVPRDFLDEYGTQ